MRHTCLVVILVYVRDQVVDFQIRERDEVYWCYPCSFWDSDQGVDMADILERKKTHFVVWRPKPGAAPPVLVIGQFQFGNPPSMSGLQRFPLAPVVGFDD